jgi:hypothetical protein
MSAPDPSGARPPQQQVHEDLYPGGPEPDQRRARPAGGPAGLIRYTSRDRPAGMTSRLGLTAGVVENSRVAYLASN